MLVSQINPSQQIYSPKPTTGKKIAVGLSSLVAPGLGQAVNGQWGKGALCVAGTVATTISTQMLGQKILHAAIYNMEKDSKKALLNIMKSKTGIKFGLSLLGLLAIRAASIIDAVKNTKADAQ